MLYGHREIDIGKLKEWVNGWQKDKFLDVLNKKFGHIQPLIKHNMEGIIDAIKGLQSIYGDEEYYEALISNISPVIMDIYFKHDDSSIKVANFYEVLLYPTDLETKKKLIKGYEYEQKKIGEVVIKESNNVIGVIGEKSDLIWIVFYDDFIVEEHIGIDDEEAEFITTSPIHTHDHENYLSLQLWNIDSIDEDMIDSYVQETLYNCWTKLGLSLGKMSVNPLYREKGEDNNYILDFEHRSFDNIPLLYFNSTFQDMSVRIKFLSYYQVIEHYYVRANNLLFKDKFIEYKLHEPGKYDPYKMTNIIKHYNKISREREAIKLVLTKAIDVNEFKVWLSANPQELKYYTKNTDTTLCSLNIDLSKTDDKIISKIGERIYTLRCSVVHSKADIDEVLYVPNLNDMKLVNEIPLISFVASKVLETWGVDLE